MAIKPELAQRNRLFALIPREERDRVAEDLVPTTLPLGRELYPGGGPIDAVYFPLDCVISVLEGADGVSVEMATIGNEGLVGAFAILHSGKTTGRYLVQVAGDALRLEIARFNQYLKESAAFQTLMHRYLFALTRQIIQAGACNQLHTTEQRCARWLLMTHDRAGSDRFVLTQGFLAALMGMRRATVNSAIRTLKDAGVIRYNRGHIFVIDRAGLESRVCPCYELIRHEYAELGL
jgi:CRP-like cAMP-binding protein